MKTIILSNNAVYSGNKGCEALGYSAIYILNKILKEKQIDAKIYITESGCIESQQKNIIIDDEVYTFEVIIPPTTLLKFLRLIYSPKEFIRVMKIYKKADYILDIGFGDSFSDIYGKQRFNSIFSEYTLSKIFNIKHCILPQTIGPYYDKKIKNRAIKAINRSSLVTVRDKQSYDFISPLINKKVHELIDLAFFLPYKKTIFANEKINVGLNISSLLYHGGYTKNNQFNLSVDYKQLIDTIIDKLSNIENVVLHLIPHVVEKEIDHVENDYAVSYKIVESLNKKNIILSPFFLDPIIAKNYISGLDFFIGSRMHATIAAISSGVPVVPLAYSRKFNGLFIETLKYPYLNDLTTDSIDIISTNILECYDKRLEIKNIIKDRVNSIVDERKILMWKILSEFISDGEN